MAMMMKEIFTGSGTRLVLAMCVMCVSVAPPNHPQTPNFLPLFSPSTSSSVAGDGRGAPIKSVTPTGNSAVVNTLKQGQREGHGGPRAR